MKQFFPYWKEYCKEVKGIEIKGLADPNAKYHPDVKGFFLYLQSKSVLRERPKPVVMKYQKPKSIHELIEGRDNQDLSRPITWKGTRNKDFDELNDKERAMVMIQYEERYGKLKSKEDLEQFYNEEKNRLKIKTTY